uniref:Uncharacterized protein n=1 Tax=Macrostomum lignano TaxID=282301 RepID=A0A1I8IKD6_9PLAT
MRYARSTARFSAR